MNAQELFMYIPIHPSHRVPQIPGAVYILYCKTFTVHNVREGNHILVIGEIQDIENAHDEKQTVLLVYKQNFYTVL
jgi:flavin reductase (DIM6/NTAB) family NADH-FMN oxidoreductase RutF